MALKLAWGVGDAATGPASVAASGGGWNPFSRGSEQRTSTLHTLGEASGMELQGVVSSLQRGKVFGCDIQSGNDTGKTDIGVTRARRFLAGALTVALR